MSTKVLLCGVGGQGTILAAHVLAQAALKSGYAVKVSEIHGMAQRGGAVRTDVAFGEEVDSMVADIGTADVVVSFELIEALRNLPMLKDGGHLIASDEVIKPTSVLTGIKPMPVNARERLQDAGALIVPAHATAIEAGNAKTSNIVLLGALAAYLPFDASVWEEAVRNAVPPKTVDVNLAAFRAGKAFVTEKETAR